MRTAHVVSSAGRTRPSRRRDPILGARPEAPAIRPGEGGPTIWLLLVVAIGAVIGSLACADSVAAGAHHGTLPSLAIVDEPVGVPKTDHAPQDGHGSHRSGARSAESSPASEPSSASDVVGGHAGLPCVTAIDLRREPISPRLLASGPIAPDAPTASERPSPPDPPVPRPSRVPAS